MNVVPMTPITSVKVLQNIPLDSTYKDTLKFNDVSSQISYFTSKAKRTFTDLMAVRFQNGIRLPVPADFLFDCNYIMFQNANFTNKWFYAFITKIDYINPNNCEVFFELDVLQTWQFDYTIKPSLVVREHVNNDTVGSNLTTENIDIGNYITREAEKTPYFNTYQCVIAMATDSNSGGLYSGLFSGVDYIPFPMSNASEIQDIKDFLSDVATANKQDSIVSMFTMPTDLISLQALPKMLRYDATKYNTNVGGYVPRNKKLLTYPYNFMSCYTSDGANTIYRYEYFQGSTCGFNVQCATTPNPEVVLEPLQYKNQDFNVDECLTMGNFPQLSYNIDSFKAWLAGNTTSTALTLGATALGMMSANPMAMTMGAMGMASTVNGIVQASMRPPSVRGTQGNSTFTATREKNFYFANTHVTTEYARIIDEYFDVYGYAVNRVKVPNVTGRPNWNYVQTEKANIVGSVPFDDISRIRNIFDNGVTFWHTTDVGNYNLNNTI